VIKANQSLVNMFFCDSEEQIWADVGSDVAAVAVPQQAHDRQSLIQQQQQLQQKQQLQHPSKPLPQQQQQQQQWQEQEAGTEAAEEAPRRKPRANISALLSS
jgi:hypothetical protein